MKTENGLGVNVTGRLLCPETTINYLSSFLLFVFICVPPDARKVEIGKTNLFSLTLFSNRDSCITLAPDFSATRSSTALTGLFWSLLSAVRTGKGSYN